MAVGFGFSVGDLVTSLKLIKDSIEAVKDAKGASADYAALLAEIDCLRDGFEAIDDLQLDRNGSPKQKTAIHRAIDACQKCVDDFLLSISKYQPHLNSTASGLTSNYRKIKWALCRKDDVATFRSQLERHTSSINMLLITFQASKETRSGERENSLSLNVRARDENRDDQILALFKTLSIEQRQCFEFLMHQNQELMRNVQDLDRMLRIQMIIPPQVLLQQPVILLDAFGKIAPFHLDFIDSLDAFIAVLNVRFRQAGIEKSGLSKLKNREFSIQETRRKRLVDLSKPWSTLFQPGQKVDMSMIFHRFACPPRTCPGCSNINEGDEEQTQCPECGLHYQHIQATKKPFDPADQPSLHHKTPPDRSSFLYVIQRPGMTPETKTFFPTTDLEDDSFALYRRVQLISQSITSFQTNQFPPQQLEAFREFVLLFIHSATAKRDPSLPYVTEMKRLSIRITEHITHTRNMPAFSSFSRIKRWQAQLTEESSVLRADIDRLFDIICHDPESERLVQHLEIHSTRPLGYYATLLQNALKPRNLSSAHEDHLHLYTTWWRCCQGGHVNNLAICPIRCPTDGHDKCDKCDKCAVLRVSGKGGDPTTFHPPSPPVKIFPRRTKPKDQVQWMLLDSKG